MFELESRGRTSICLYDANQKALTIDSNVLLLIFYRLVFSVQTPSPRLREIFTLIGKGIRFKKGDWKSVSFVFPLDWGSDCIVLHQLQSHAPLGDVRQTGRESGRGDPVILDECGMMC